MKQVTTYVGMDAHKKDLFIAMFVGAQQRRNMASAKRAEGGAAVGAQARARRAGARAHVLEAGPCGYALQRQVMTPRVSCEVIAPALIPRKPGERVKINRRDARKLAELGRAGLLTEVRPPTPEDEAVRDRASAG